MHGESRFESKESPHTYCGQVRGHGVFFPYFRLIEEGWEVDVAAPTKDRIRGEHGYSMEPGKKFDEINQADYALLVIPGGFPNGAPRTVSKNRAAVEITKAFFVKNKPVASICHGPYVLVAADAVRGRKLTSFWHDGVPRK